MGLSPSYQDDYHVHYCLDDDPDLTCTDFHLSFYTSFLAVYRKEIILLCALTVKKIRYIFRIFFQKKESPGTSPYFSPRCGLACTSPMGENTGMSTQQDTEQTSTSGVVESTGSRFYTLLVQLGIPAALAAAIIGAIYAALVALGVLALPSCRASVDLLPGEQHFNGELYMLEIEEEVK